MKQTNFYKVGGHIFTLTLEDKLAQEIDFSPYEPFKIAPTEAGTLFNIEFVDKLDEQTSEPLIIDAPLSSSGMPNVNIYKLENGLRYDISAPRSNEVNASVAVDYAARTTQVVLSGTTLFKQLSMTNALILSYISFTLEHSTLLLHASTVMLDGKAYMFLGKSGTGKSTHSRMWLEAFKEQGVELLNDDHPIVRTHDDGSIIVYGSPWSGKTPCYRNLSAPLGAIVRIKRAGANSLEALRPLQAFASITTSCSGVQWCKELMGHKVSAIEKIVRSNRGYAMHCLPNKEAAQVCYQGILESK